MSRYYEMENRKLSDEVLTPKRIVQELDKYIIGQAEAKKCVAIAIRNRWRRQQLPPELRDEVAPKNIIMIGPTGVGKTEIARRLAALIDAPFVKVEATRYTEVGYHGRDVDSMVRELVEVSINMRRAEQMKLVREKAEKNAEERLLDILLPDSRKRGQKKDSENGGSVERTRQRLREKLLNGSLESRTVEIAVEERIIPMMQIVSGSGIEELGLDVQSMLGHLFPPRTHTRKVTVREARQILLAQESEKLIDKDKVIREGLQRAENAGIIFLDEIDKIVGSQKIYGPDVSREGVQRDLLPIVEGATVFTRYGPVKTDHILFIAAGAFHNSKPSDLIPELQGRFPLRVELSSLTKTDFIRILTEPENALVKQYRALLKTEGVTVEFTDDGIDEIAQIATELNEKTLNIGARRLHTVMEKVFEDISFNAPPETPEKIIIDRKHVNEKLSGILRDEDLSRYIL